ncbi:MAG: diguanylate phosphodiesterase, partial [Campylobacterota bacterium]
MNIINISKQKIFDNKNQIYAYELVFMDDSNNEAGLSSKVKGTAQLIMGSIANKELDKLLGNKTVA